jgi:hypothetical protein
MIIQDDRTEDQKLTHTHLVIGTDRFMSGWGKAQGGVSYAAWACRPEHRDKVLSWMVSRSDQSRIREAYSKNYRPKGIGHTHIYVVNQSHNALKQG